MTDVRSIELVPGVPGPTNHGTSSNCGWARVDGHHSCHVLLRRSFRPLEEPIVRWTAARKKLRVTGGNDAMLAFVGGGTTIASGTRNHFMAKTGSDYRLAHTSSGTVTHAEARCRRPHQLVCGVGTLRGKVSISSAPGGGRTSERGALRAGFWHIRPCESEWDQRKQLG